MSRQRAWLLSPSIATAIFFAAQICLSFSGGDRGDAMTAAAADTPSAVPVEVRVVAQIHSLERKTKPTTVPETEEALFMLMARDGTVIFGSEEVDVVSTPAREFVAGEVTVIRARATLAP